MATQAKGHRVFSFEEIQLAGDYFGPVNHDGRVTVFYLLPNARDPEIHGDGRSVRYVVSPPHVFTEEKDGALYNQVFAQKVIEWK